MITTRFARLELAPWGATTRFHDGTCVPAQHHPEDHHYRVISHRTGYGDDTRRYAIEHEVCHLLVEEALHGRPSRVLWGLAHGAPLSPHDAVYEEFAAQALQRFVRAAERPIVGGVDWDALRTLFRKTMGES